MKENNIPEEFSTYKVCLKECFEAANGVAALEIFNGMKRSFDNTIDHESIGLTVKTTCKAYRYDRKLWRKGLKILYDYGNDASTKNEQSGERKTIAIDVYNSMLSCMEEEKLWKESLKLLDLMEQESKKISFHPKPNIGSYHTILNTCIAARETEQAVQILLRMPEKGLMVSYIIVFHNKHSSLYTIIVIHIYSVWLLVLGLFFKKMLSQMYTHLI